jgi:hypothetical protein
MTKIITNILAFFAKKSKNVKTQCLLATVYGLVTIFGIGGTVQIMLKMKSQVEKEQARARKANS